MTTATASGPSTTFNGADSVSENTLKVVCLLDAVQISDIMGVDIIGSCSRQYVAECATVLPPWKALIPLATPMKFYYPATTLEETFMTPNVRILPNCTYDDCPRDADIVLIGGPLLSHRPAAADKFMKEMADKAGVIMTTCIGALWLASSGVMKGKKATVTRGALPLAKMMHPEVEWLDQRWVIDGNLWTAGGAGAGIDMVTTWALQQFGPSFVQTVATDPLDLDPTMRGQFYDDSAKYGAKKMEFPAPTSH